MNLRSPGALRSKAQALIHFFTAQGLAMAANLLYGLLCVRLLPSSEYAKFVVVFGVQGSLLGIMDANLSGTLIPLVGERVDDHKLIADYVATLRQLALGAYFLVCTAFLFIFPVLVKNRHWSWQTIVAMLGILLVSTWSFRISTIYGAVMLMMRDRGRWYQGQLISALGTLALLLIAWFLHRLGAFEAIVFNVIGIIFVAWFYSKNAKRLLSAKGEVSAEKRRSIIRLALPNMPGALFYAVQGQIPLYLITWLGRTSGVAGMGALGRLGQIFSILQQGNPILVEPYFAKLPRERLARAYLVALALGTALALVIFCVAIMMPQIFLWVLGPQYAGLSFEVRLVMASSSIAFVNGVLWSMHTARRFVYWWSTGASLGLTFLVQLIFIFFGNMSVLRGVLWMSLVMNAVALTVSLACGLWGFARGPRDFESPGGHGTDATIEADTVLKGESAEVGLAHEL